MLIIISTIREPLLVLDDKLRSFPPAGLLSDLPGEAEETEGQLIYELGNRQWEIAELRRY